MDLSEEKFSISIKAKTEREGHYKNTTSSKDCTQRKHGCVCSNSSSAVVVDLHPPDQLRHQLLDGVRAQPAHLQDPLVGHTVRVLVALPHLSINQSINT